MFKFKHSRHTFGKSKFQLLLKSETMILLITGYLYVNAKRWKFYSGSNVKLQMYSVFFFSFEMHYRTMQIDF